MNPDEEFQDTNIYNYGDDQLLVYGKIKVSNHYFEATTVKFQVKWDGDEEWTTVQEEVGLPADGSPVDVDVASIDRVGETNGVCPDQRVFSVRFVVVENGNDVDEHQENVVTFVKNPSETSGGSNEDEPGDEAPLPPS